MNLKFSIITPSLNQGRFIRDTIESVLNQDYKNFEHIIIDGRSTDNTLEIIKEYPHLIWISERDKGVAGAINKGFKMATGDIFAWINSDDYYEKNIFSLISKNFIKNPLVEFIYGNLTFIKDDHYLNDKTEEYSVDMFIHYSADFLRQPCCFFTSKLFFKVGGLDENLKLVFDYDLFIKMLKVTKPLYLNHNFAYQRMYSETLTKRNLNRQAWEIFKVSRKYGARIYERIMYNSILKKIIFPNKF